MTRFIFKNRRSNNSGCQYSIILSKKTKSTFVICRTSKHHSRIGEMVRNKISSEVYSTNFYYFNSFEYSPHPSLGIMLKYEMNLTAQKTLCDNLEGKYTKKVIIKSQRQFMYVSNFYGSDVMYMYDTVRYG